MTSITDSISAEITKKVLNALSLMKNEIEDQIRRDVQEALRNIDYNDLFDDVFTSKEVHAKLVEMFVESISIDIKKKKARKK